MARVLLLLFLLVLVAGGGTGAWWFGVRGEPIPFIDDGEAEEGPDPRLAHQPSEFMSLDPLSFPVIESGSARQLMTFVISLEVAGEPGRQAVSQNRLRLRDALMTELHGLYRLRYVREHENEMDIVRSRLLVAGQEVIGEHLRGVFIQAVEGRDAR